MTTQSYLLDVRTPTEYSTGTLSTALNIPFEQVPDYLLTQGASKDAPVTLFCRSGRRSGIAKGELERLGFVNVRDLGSLEEARGVLEGERERGVGREAVGLSGREGVKESGGGEDRSKARKDAFEELLGGLREG